METFNTGWGVKPYYRVAFSDAQMYRWLLKIGLFPAKTLTMGKINIPKKYFRDFLRGHLDGDGCITTFKDKWNTFKNPKYVYIRLCVRFQSSSQAHIEWLRKNIKENLGIDGNLWGREPKKEYQNAISWELKFAKKRFLSNITLAILFPTCSMPEKKKRDSK